MKSVPDRFDPAPYCIRTISSLGEVGQAVWNDLAGRQPAANPFVSFAFLNALHESQSASPSTGWRPQFLTAWKGETLAAAAPLYAKTHSYGEYVFDWAWADAYRRHGLAYYPKLLSAIPFTPVTGPRLLAANEAARTALIGALKSAALESGSSSTHILFPVEHEAAALRDAGFLMRSGVQFHWHNPGYCNFDDFLATLERKKRKNIRAERRQVAQAGINFQHVAGREASEADWAFFKHCYDLTYAAHHSTPYLNLDFFLRIGAAMPDNILLVFAERAGRRIAASLVLHDSETLYGRYWGSTEYHPALHFETAYYQPLEFCIARGIRRFEGGAQGEHKMARGFLPWKTWGGGILSWPGICGSGCLSGRIERAFAFSEGLDA
jgi:uncharacterized protein